MARKPKSSTLVLGARSQRLLSESVRLNEELVPAFIRPALMLMALVITLFLVWAATVPITELASASGEVVPVGSLRTVQAPDGGSVAEVHAREGQVVEAGDPLFRLDDSEARSELDQFVSRRANLRLRAERLAAFVDGRDPDFGDMPARYANLAAGQLDILARQRQSQEAALAVLDSQIQQRRSELGQLEWAFEIAKEQLTLSSELLEMRQRLAARNLISRVDLLETQRAKVTAEGEVLRIKEQIDVATGSIAENEQRRASLLLDAQRDAIQELGVVNAELTELGDIVEKLQARIERAEIRAPVSGIVHDLKVKERGEVVMAGETIMNLLPTDEDLQAEVKISPRDIGHVRVGQEVEVKLASYDYGRYGGVDGRLERISATRIIENDGNAYFLGRVSLSKNYVGEQEGLHPVLPGMAVTVDIKTGQKTLLAYLGKPIADAVDRAFTER